MFYTEKIDGISFYKSSLLDDERLIHFFTTRIGDNNLHLQENRKKTCAMLGLKYENLVVPEQKHTDNIKIINSPNENVSECDGLITQNPEIILMLLFADCVPVIMYAPDQNAVSVVHAGWRGTAKSIVKKAVGILEKDFNADITQIKAVIGQAIGSCCYPVSEDTSEILEMTIAKDYNNIFTTNIENDKLIFVDLKKLNEQQLRECGLVRIDKSDNCTCCMNSIFYSYRAENGKTGRHAAIARLC